MRRSDFLKTLFGGAAITAVAPGLILSALKEYPKLPESTGPFADADWEIDVNTKNIRYIGPDDGPPVKIVDLHRWLQAQADDMPGDGMLDITDPNPSIRHTDEVIELLGDVHIAEPSMCKLHGTIITSNQDIWSSV